MLRTQCPEGPEGQVLIWSISPLLWYKDAHPGQFPATSLMSLNLELGKDAQAMGL